VYDKQALVLVNRGTGGVNVTGGEVMTLASAIQTSVYERFGIRLNPSRWWCKRGRFPALLVSRLPRSAQGMPQS
jgi:UDP-N-acetylenolpyruvoylglucosamine reductase